MMGELRARTLERLDYLDRENDELVGTIIELQKKCEAERTRILAAVREVLEGYQIVWGDIEMAIEDIMADIEAKLKEKEG